MAFGRLIEIISGPEGDKGLSITDLAMSFEVERGLSKTPNKAEVSIYNLSDSSMAKMGGSRNKLIVKAGYADEGGLYSLFFGDVQKSEIVTEQKDRVLKISALDGYKSIQDKNVKLSYARNTKIMTVLNDILAVMAYPVINKPSSNLTYSGGYSFIGKAQNALTQVLSRIGYKWTIQNNQIIIYQPGKSAVSTALVLGSNTGLLSIEKLEQDVTKKEKEAVKYKVVTLLFPQMVPGSLVKIDSSLFKGKAFIESARIYGDNFGGDFQVEAEVRVAQ